MPSGDGFFLIKAILSLLPNPGTYNINHETFTPKTKMINTNVKNMKNFAKCLVVQLFRFSNSFKSTSIRSVYFLIVPNSFLKNAIKSENLVWTKLGTCAPMPVIWTLLIDRGQYQLLCMMVERQINTLTLSNCIFL